MFCRYSLRTTDAEAGRKFYAEAIGLALPNGADPGSLLEAWPLHEQARARGAPAHWLGQIAVDDLDAYLERVVALGGERLGPIVATPSGVRFATLRDPFGAVLGLRQQAAAMQAKPVAWHQLHTRDAERACEVYCELFGWAHVRTLEVADPEGGHRLFAFRRGETPVGSIANTGRWPGVHPHWLFHFPVADLDAAVARVRALGGNAFDPVTFEHGARVAACEDPQGAAFGLASVKSGSARTGRTR